MGHPTLSRNQPRPSLREQIGHELLNHYQAVILAGSYQVLEQLVESLPFLEGQKGGCLFHCFNGAGLYATRTPGRTSYELIGSQREVSEILDLLKIGYRFNRGSINPRPAGPPRRYYVGDIWVPLRRRR